MKTKITATSGEHSISIDQAHQNATLSHQVPNGSYTGVLRGIHKVNGDNGELKTVGDQYVWDLLKNGKPTDHVAALFINLGKDNTVTPHEDSRNEWGRIHNLHMSEKEIEDAKDGTDVVTFDVLIGRKANITIWSVRTDANQAFFHEVTVSRKK